MVILSIAGGSSEQFSRCAAGSYSRRRRRIEGGGSFHTAIPVKITFIFLFGKKYFTAGFRPGSVGGPARSRQGSVGDPTRFRPASASNPRPGRGGIAGRSLGGSTEREDGEDYFHAPPVCRREKNDGNHGNGNAMEKYR